MGIQFIELGLLLQPVHILANLYDNMSHEDGFSCRHRVNEEGEKVKYGDGSYFEWEELKLAMHII